MEEIELREFYIGKSLTEWRAYLNGQVIARAKDRIALIRQLAKKG